MHKLIKYFFKILIIGCFSSFYSCSYFYNKCDHCNLSYQDDEIVYSNRFQISYHKTCYDNWFYPNLENKNKKLLFVKDNLNAYRLLKETKYQLNKIGLNVTENIELKIDDAKNFQVRKG